MPSSSFFSGTNPTPTEYQTAVDLVAQATQQATAALASQSAAAASAQSSQGYSVSAGESATTATNQASSAASSAAGAANSATAAATSATNASNSATAASTSATNAANSATAASTSATNAASSASAATSSASAAATSETNAAASAASAASTLASALVKTNNLSDLSNVATARSNLGLVASATTDTTNASNISSGTLSNSRLSGVLLTANNLSEVNAASARSNLGLSTVAATGAYSDLSGKPALVASATTDTTNASNISSGTLAVARGGTGVSTSTGSGSVVLSNSPTLVTPALGTPSSATLTNATGLPVATGISGLGTGVATALGVNTGSAGAVVVNGGALGTPASGNLSNCTFPTLNQNTTGTASNVTGTVEVANGGTGLTSLTAGRIPYGNGTNAFNSNSKLVTDGTHLTINDTAISVYPLNVKQFSADNFGINVTASDGTSVCRMLHNGTVAAINVSYTGGGSYTPLTFWTSDLERMRLDASGNLGLGVTPSAWSAGKAVEVGAKGSALWTANAIDNYVLCNAYYDGSFKYGASAAASGYEQISGAHRWFTAPSGTAGNAISFTQAMTLDASGNLGIGTSSPQANLHVQGSTASIRVTGTSGTAAYYQATSATVRDWSFGCRTTGNFVFNSGNNLGGTDYVTIDTSGNLLVGTTSELFRLSIAGPATTKPLSQFYSNTAGDVSYPAIRIIKTDNNSTTSQKFIEFQISAGGSGSGQINANGASAAAFGTYSDARLKENIVALSDQLANICALKPSEFDYRDGSGHQTGFIAQEMQQVYPDVVGEGDDGMLVITGWSKTEARLVKAIQELAAKVTALEEQLNG